MQSDPQSTPGRSTALNPIERAERIGLLDTMRGVAVLGILIMNITAFGLPRAYEDPTIWGGHSGADLQAWLTASLLFEGTMRGLFTLLFGAGAWLFLARHVARDTCLRPADLYFRRTLWLIAFGLVNGYVLLWPGDILYLYGVVGLLLFVFRNLRPRRLIAAAALILALQVAVTVVEWTGYHRLYEQGVAVLAVQAAGQPLTSQQRAISERFTELSDDFKPQQSTLHALIANMRASYLSALRMVAHETWYLETAFFFRHGLLESLGMMLLGMALLKLGVLNGSAATRVYVVLASAGYALGLSVNLFETGRLMRESFSIEALLDSSLTYDLGRIPLTLGHVGLIGLLYRARPSSPAARTLGAVGQMALTNYLAQSCICMLLFTGAGLAWYGQLQRHQLYYVVVAIWIAQLFWSVQWLRRFHFGPAEWLWRSLTYWQAQRMKRIADNG